MTVRRYNRPLPKVIPLNALRPKEAAEFLEISEKELRMLGDEQILEHIVTPGQKGHRRYLMSGLMAYLAGEEMRKARRDKT